MTPHISEYTLARLPVLSVPRQVAFPGTCVPLRVSDAPQCTLLQDCLRGPDPWLVVAQARPPRELGGETGAEAGAGPSARPLPARSCASPFFDIAGLGYVSRYRVRSDGSFELEVEATARVHLSELPDNDPDRHRRSRGLILPDRNTRSDQRDLSALLSLAGRIGDDLRRAQPDFELTLPPADAGPGAVTDYLADQLVLNPLVRQDILETLDVRRRIRAVVDQLARLHLALRPRDQDVQRMH